MRYKKENARLLQQSNAQKGVSQDPLIVSVFKAAVNGLAICVAIVAIFAVWMAASKLIEWAISIAPLSTVTVLFFVSFFALGCELRHNRFWRD